METMCKPLVSIIMSSFNEEKYIEESIKSILNQSYKNIELIIIDDASTDNTFSLLEAINDNRICLFRNKYNMKLAHNLNSAIDHASGEFIARMDCDDISINTRIENQVNYLMKHHDVDVVGSFAKSFGKRTEIMRYPLTQDEIKATLFFENAFCHPSVMFRKASLDYKYNEQFQASQDYELWTRIIWNKQLRNIPKILLRYRVHNNQTVSKNGDKQKKFGFEARKQMLSKLIPELTDKDEKIYYTICYDYSAKNADQLGEIEAFLYNLIKENSKKKLITNEVFYNVAMHRYYLQWRSSLGHNGITIQVIKDSSFSQAFNKLSFFNKLYLYIISLIKQLIQG